MPGNKALERTSYPQHQVRQRISDRNIITKEEWQSLDPEARYHLMSALNEQSYPFRSRYLKTRLARNHDNGCPDYYFELGPQKLTLHFSQNVFRWIEMVQ